MAAEALHERAVDRGRRRAGAYWFDIIFGRLIPALFFSVFIIDKGLLFRDSMDGLPGHLAQPSAYLGPVSQVLGLAYFTMLAFLYIIRLPKRAGDARPLVILVSFVGSFSIVFVTLLPGVPVRQNLQLPAALLSAGGLAYSVWALSYLRRSFSIMPEARRLVVGGPYNLNRHPLYFGEAAAAIGVTIPTIGWAGLLLLAFFLTAQYLRMRAEERILEREFPEYAEYRKQVPRYLPDPRRLWKAAP